MALCVIRRITQHKKFMPNGTHPNFCFAKTSFMLVTLCVSVKSQRSVKHIWFLPTLKPNAEKTKIACPFPTHDKTMKNYTE